MNGHTIGCDLGEALFAQCVAILRAVAEQDHAGEGALPALCNT